MTRGTWLVAAALSVALVGGCTGGEGESEVDGEVSAAIAAQEGFDWPLTVDSASYICAEGNAVAIEADGSIYALNGLAKGQGYLDLEPIWKDDPEFDGLKVAADGLTDYVLAQCGY